MSNTGPTSATLQCGACGQANSGEAQFCAGCGHGLFEDCAGCSARVTLSQKFCVACGKDLAATLEARRQKQERRLADAVQEARHHQYEQAMALLKPVMDQTDYRFRDLAEKARQAATKVRELEQRMSVGADGARAQAHQAFERGDLREARRLLELVPPALMDAESKRMLTHCRTYLDRVTELHRDLQAALAEKRYREAGDYLDALLELVPDNPKYQKLARQVSEKLQKRAAKSFERRDYAGAMRSLNSVPKFAHDTEYFSARGRIETVEWLTAQFPVEPFATASLGRLAVRYQREVPDDENAQALIRELSARVKQRPADRRLASPTWRKSRRSWLGGDAGVLAVPQSIEFGDGVRADAPVGQFAVAFGLALQGLGLGRISQPFYLRKGLLSALGGGRRNACWGIDVGSSGIKAVLLRKEKGDERPVAIRFYSASYPAPTCRPGQERRAAETIRQALEAMLEEIELGDAAVWVNLPAPEVVSRFVHLPPVKEKQAENLIEMEARQRIPIPIEDLNLVRWLGPRDDETMRGRPAFVAAATKTATSRRLEQLEVEGLRIDGMQADPIALVNFADHEFTDLWEVDDEPKGDESEEAVPPSDRTEEEREPAVVLVDSGASKTSLIFVSRHGFWYWTYESGGEDLTTLLARATKNVAGDAEELKRNPSAIEQPGTMYEPLENRMMQLRERLKKLAEEALEEFDYLDVVACWCVGKAALAHGWIRRVLLSIDDRAS